MKTMKTIVTLLLLVLCTLPTSAQEQYITHFMGIPVDGSKSEMIKKIEDKGFEYDPTLDVLTGEFNGEQVYVSVVTNNNKVYRVFVTTAKSVSPSQLKIKYSNLLQQFKNNPKYLFLGETDSTLEDADLEYEMRIHHKEYQVSFMQIPPQDKLAPLLTKYMSTIFTKEQLSDLSFYVSNEYNTARTLFLLDNFKNNSVWFCVSQKGYNEFGLSLYYDNTNNQAHGEDL